MKRMAFLASTAIAACLFATAANAGVVRGQVSDSSGTRGLQGAVVTIVELGQTATVGADGSFRFGDVRAGSYTLRATFAGAAAQTRQVTVSETGEISVDFALSSIGAEAGSTNLDDVLVIGQRANFLSSISRQRSADNVQTVLTRDAMGQFPDQNVAEALRRAPGLNVLNDQGEGRFVSVRGLDPQLNSASINGNRVLATGGDDRAVALDVIPSELIESIEIKKSLTPDMDADTIGGSIDIATTSSLDRRRNLYTVSLEGSYNDLNEETSPKGSLDFVHRFNDRFGIAGGLSYYDRSFSTDNVEMDGWKVTDDGAVYAEDLEYRDYDVTRKRYGGTLNFDFRLNDSTQLYLRGLYSKFDDSELRSRLIFGFDEPTTVVGDVATFDSADGRIRVERDLKDRREVQSVRTISAGGRTDIGAWRFTYDLAWSEADQTENGSIDPIEFRMDFDDESVEQLGVSIDYSDLRRPGYAINFGQADFLNPELYAFNALERTTREDALDEEFSARFDAAYDMPLSNGSLELKFGGKVRQRDKQNLMTYDIYDGYDGDFTLADVVGRASYGLAAIDPVPGLREVRDFVGNYAGFERNALESDFASLAESYTASEDIYAGYGQARYESGPLRVVGGVRVEMTETETNGTRVEINEDTETLTVTPLTFSRDYTDWMPSVNVRYEVAEDIVARFGAFRSIMRPTFGKMAPRFLIEENEDGDRAGEFGNPDLDPYRAWNFDATLEYYFAPEAVIQGGVFYKKINDFIVDFNDDQAGTFNGIEYSEALIPLNGGEATVFGVELSYGQALSFLPGPFDGLLVNFNYTYTDTEGSVPTDANDGTTRLIPLPASAKHTFNAVLGYEKGPISLRLAGAYRSSYLDELGSTAEDDRYIRSHFQVDLSGKYRVTENVQLFAELVNLNDATYTAYQNRGDRDRLLQYEEYSWTGKFGVKLTF